MKLLEVGTISHGTMREEDLIPRFLNALESVNPDRAQEIRESHRSDIENLLKDDLTEDEASWISWLLNEVLFDALGEHCPENHYFGAHPGDGSDYGVWPCDME